MTDESNGEAGFEFIEKKSEELPSISVNDALKIDAVNTNIVSGSVLTTVTSPMTTSNILSNVAPPSALPSFITNSILMSSNALKNQSQELITNENVKLTIQQLQNINSTELTSSSSYNIPQVLIAPDSPAMDTGVRVGSLFTWVKDTVTNSNVLSKVAEKAKNSVNSMITILDPQMREFIYSGGDLEIIVASNKDSKVAAVREAFQNVFGNATVNGTEIETAFEIVQPIGFAAGVKAAQEKIAIIRKSPLILDDIPIIAIENFLLEVDQSKWYDLSVIILEDLKQNINLQTFTQMTPVPSKIVEIAQESTPKSYSENGLAVAIDNLMGSNLQVSHIEWHSELTGVSKKDIIFLAAKSLAGIYKNTINPI